jgi:cullin-4
MEHVKTAASIELMVNVLTMGYWPTYIPMDVVLPEEVMHFIWLF